VRKWQGTTNPLRLLKLLTGSLDLQKADTFKSLRRLMKLGLMSMTLLVQSGTRNDSAEVLENRFFSLYDSPLYVTYTNMALHFPWLWMTPWLTSMINVPKPHHALLLNL
jgi:hypothetical protein